MEAIVKQSLNATESKLLKLANEVGNMEVKGRGVYGQLVESIRTMLDSSDGKMAIQHVYTELNRVSAANLAKVPESEKPERSKFAVWAYANVKGYAAKEKFSSAFRYAQKGREKPLSLRQEKDAKGRRFWVLGKPSGTRAARPAVTYSATAAMKAIADTNKEATLEGKVNTLKGLAEMMNIATEIVIMLKGEFAEEVEKRAKALNGAPKPTRKPHRNKPAPAAQQAAA